LMWLAVHVMYLIGFKNRLTTMLHWAVSFIFRGRSQRTTTRQQIVARTLMARLESTQDALQEAQEQKAAPVEASDEAASSGASADLRPEPVEGSASTSSATNSQSEAAGIDSVDELTAAYGEKKEEVGEAASLKQAPES
jgi:NADH:ubiquinone reductase (H+-translocating)